MTIIAEKIQKVRSDIDNVCLACHRDPKSVLLLAVSKTRTETEIRTAYESGLHAFGENYLQEALEKQKLISDLKIEWHFIGPIQSNKTRAISEHFDWVHSVDRLKIAERFSSQRPSHLPPLNVCIQVNISGEDTKSGCNPDEVPALAQAIAKLPGICLRGLMAIPEVEPDPEQQRTTFAKVRALMTQLQAEGLDLDTLSMGMSGDLAAAIYEGSTIVRVGTALFGQRT